METNPPEYNDKNGFISNVDKILFRLKLRKFIKMLPSDCTLILADNKAWMKFEKYRYVSKWLKKNWKAAWAQDLWRRRVF